MYISNGYKKLTKEVVVSNITDILNNYDGVTF